MIVDKPKDIEECVNIFLKNFNYKNKKELYKIDIDTLKAIIFGCAELKQKYSKIIKDSNFNNKEHDAYIIYDDVEHLDTKNNVIGYEREMTIKKLNPLPIKTPKKISKKTSKRISKKTTKKTSKRGHKK
jgi:hypothetical protein